MEQINSSPPSVQLNEKVPPSPTAPSSCSGEACFYRVGLDFLSSFAIRQSSSLIAGLLELCRRKAVEIDWKDDVVDATVMVLTVSNGTRTLKLGFDYHDKSYNADRSTLEICDLIFKRSYFPDDLQTLPLEFQKKIRPMDPVFACRPKSLLPFPWHKIASRLISGSDPGSRLKEFASNFRLFSGLALPSSYEHPPQSPRNALIVFQTRAWEDFDVTGAPPSAFEINERRATLIRALRKAFGSQFVGGFVPTPYARNNYPDLITSHPTRRGRYIDLLKSAQIGIYSIGLHHSVAWKMAEYLANSACIVSEPLRNSLWHPLRERVNFMEFESPEQCVENCRQLLSDPEFSMEMQQANWTYYHAYSEPSRQLLNCFDLAFSGALISPIPPCSNPQPKVSDHEH